MNRRLIVVDDEKDLLDAYRGILSPAKPAISIVSSRMKKVEQPLDGFEVTYASNGQDVLTAIATGLEGKSPFVGGFFDVRLGPGIDGIETIRRAKEMDPNLLCTIVTAYQDRRVEEIIKIFGTSFSDQWDLLTKPLSSIAIQQKAIHLVANWNRRDREEHYLNCIQHLTRQENLIKELIGDFVSRMQQKIEAILKDAPAHPSLSTLQDIQTMLTQADQSLMEVLQEKEILLQETNRRTV